MPLGLQVDVNIFWVPQGSGNTFLEQSQAAVAGQGQPIQPRGRSYEHAAGDHDKSRDELLRERAGRNGASGGAGIGGVNLCVGHAVEGHGRRPGRYHAQHDPADLRRARQAAGREQGAA